MIVISMVLVVVGFVTLMLGVLEAGEEPLNWVYTSIGACILAGVFLIAGVLRSRPSRKAAPGAAAPGPAAPGLTGAGAAGEGSSTGALPREDAGGPAGSSGPSVPSGSIGPPPVPAPTPSAPSPSASEGGTSALDSWRPQTMPSGPRTGTTSRLDQPATAAPEDEDVEEDVDEDEELLDEEEPLPDEEEPPAGEGDVTEPEPAPASEAAPAAAKKAARKGVAKKGAKSAAKKATKKSSAKKATKKSSAKKAAGKKATSKSAAKKATPAAGGSLGEAARIRHALSDVQGLGPAKQRRLAERFSSLEDLRSASVAEIAEVEGVSQPLAERVHEQLRG